MSNTEAGEDMRRRIAAFLPDAIMRALNSYHEFSQKDASENVKVFTAHHTACKVAIAHIELLLKLARWAELPDAAAENQNQQIVLAALIQEAQAEVSAYEQE